MFSHGGGSDLRYWEPQRQVFAERYRFVAASHANDLVALIRRLDARPVHLVGFSTTSALRATLREPGLVRSLTIVEPNVPWLLEGDPEGEAVLAWWRGQNERVTAEAAGDAERGAELWFELVNNRGSGTFAAQSEPFRRMWLDNFGARRPASPPQPLRCEQLGAITAPTLVVGGEYGMPYSRRIVELLAECISGSRLIVIPGVTHFMSYQEPAVFNEVVLDFLARH